VKKPACVNCILLIVAIFAVPLHSEGPSSDLCGELVIFHAGSLAVPMQQICREFNKAHPKLRIIREASGSRTCARKITELNKHCDVLAVADYRVIDELLIPDYAEWNIKFAGNEMVITFSPDGHLTKQINKDNWYDILLQKHVTFGRSDPNSDPCGYRAVLVIKLAEKFYNKPGLAERFLTKDVRYIRPKETDLLALLEVGELDYVFIYRSVAEQHKLKYLTLPEQINLKNDDFADFYKSATVRITGKTPGCFLTRAGSAIMYGITIPDNAPNREIALEFLAFLLDADKGGAVLERNGQNFLVPSASETIKKVPESLKCFVSASKKIE